MIESKKSLLRSKISSLDSIIIQPKIAFAKHSSANQLYELRAEKERLYGIAKTIQLSSSLSANDAHEMEYLRFQVESYSKNFVQSVQGDSLKINFEQLKAILSSSSCQFFQDLSYEQYQELYKTDPEQIKDCFAKYRNTLLDTLDYQTLGAQDKKLLSDFIEKKEVSRSYSSNKENSNINVNTSIYSLFDDDINNIPKGKPNVVNINDLPSVVPVDNSRIKKLLMFNEFRLFVKNKELSDDEIDHFFGNSTDIEAAAEIYFKYVSNSEKISLTYIYPNQQKQIYQFKFTESLDYLLLQVYNDHPEINSPYLMLSNGVEFSFNPIEDKCIGSLFQNGNVLYVSSKE